MSVSKVQITNIFHTGNEVIYNTKGHIFSHSVQYLTTLYLPQIEFLGTLI